MIVVTVAVMDQASLEFRRGLTCIRGLIITLVAEFANAFPRQANARHGMP